jgi:dihydroneopterin aldolase/2-amino-4-hydroxy-6-hydroxymethyldihydropteridine diphosphokinase
VTDRIDLRGIEVYAKHGVLEFEKERAQMFRVDVTAFVDLSTSGDSDDLEDTLDYGALANEVREVVGGESHALIERVAARVAESVLSHDSVSRTIVTIHKPDAPVDVAVDDISVTVDRAR